MTTPWDYIEYLYEQSDRIADRDEDEPLDGTCADRSIGELYEHVREHGPVVVDGWRITAWPAEESVTEDCPRCRHWTPVQRRWHHCIGCDGTGQVPAQQEESTR